MRRVIVALCSIGLLVTLFAPAVAADPPQKVTITSPMTVNYPNPNTGTFTATGPAVRTHLICASGTVTDVLLKLDQDPIVVLKAFVCADGSKTFVVRLQVHPNADGTESLAWTVVGGTGLYRGLYGWGTGTTDASSGQPVNTYTGSLAG